MPSNLLGVTIRYPYRIANLYLQKLFEFDSMQALMHEVIDPIY